MPTSRQGVHVPAVPLTFHFPYIDFLEGLGPTVLPQYQALNAFNSAQNQSRLLWAKKKKNLVAGQATQTWLTMSYSLLANQPKTFTTGRG